MAARGEEATDVRLKITLRQRAASSGPCRRRQARDLPPESAPRPDWLVFVYPSPPTNQIPRLSFQQLKGSEKAKQAQMTPQQQHRVLTGCHLFE